MKRKLLAAVAFAMLIAHGAYTMEEPPYKEQLAWRERVLLWLTNYSFNKKLTRQDDGADLFRDLLKSSRPALDAPFQGGPFWLSVRRSSDYHFIERLRCYEKQPEVLATLSPITLLGRAIADQDLEQVRILAKGPGIENNYSVHLLDLAFEYAYGQAHDELICDAAAVARSKEIVKLVLAIPGLNLASCKDGNPLLSSFLFNRSTNSGPVITAVFNPKWYLIPLLLDRSAQLRSQFTINCVATNGRSLLQHACLANASAEVIARICADPEIDMKIQNMTLNFVFACLTCEDWPTMVDIVYELAQWGVVFEKGVVCPNQLYKLDHSLLLGAGVEGLDVAEARNYSHDLWSGWFNALLEKQDSPSYSAIINALRRAAQSTPVSCGWEPSDGRFSKGRVIHAESILEASFARVLRVFTNIIVGDDNEVLFTEEQLQPLDSRLVYPHVRDSGGRTLLMWAAARARVDLCEKLLSAGADVRSSDARGYTALHFGILSGSVDVVKLLLKYAHKLSLKEAICGIVKENIGLAKTLSGVTAYELACRTRRDEIIQLFH